MERKKPKIAVVSGGMGYVGSEIGRRLAADGLSVAVLYHNSPKEKVDDFLSSLGGSGHRAYQCDLTDAAKVAATFAAIERDIGTPFAAIHAAGTLPEPFPLHLTTSESLRKQFEPNVFGAFNFLKSAAACLKTHGRGSLIGITTAGVIATTNTKARGAYSPQKFAVQGMLTAFKEELSSNGVRVYSVAPGVMKGGLNRETPQAFIDMVKEKSPTKTLATASDVATVVSFLCSDSSKAVTNLTLLVAPESGML